MFTYMQQTSYSYGITSIVESFQMTLLQKMHFIITILHVRVLRNWLILIYSQGSSIDNLTATSE